MDPLSAMPTTAPTNVPSGTTGDDHTTSLPSLTSSSSVAYSGDSSGQAVAPTSLSSDKRTEASTTTKSVSSTHQSKSTAGHSLSNDTVAGIVVGAAVGLAFITFLVTFLFMSRKRRSRSRRRYHRPSNGVPVLRKTRDHPVVTEKSGASSLFENHLPQSADDNTVKRRARTTLEQIGFHVETFYQNLSDVGTPDFNDQLSIFDSPYIPSALVTQLSQSIDTVPLIMHSLACFVTLSISPISATEKSLLPIEFITLPSSVGSVESNVSTNAELSQALSRWRVLTAYLHSNSSDNTAYNARVDEQIHNMATSFSNAFAPWKNGKYRSKDRVCNLCEILKQAADLGIWLFSQPSAFRFDWPTGTPQSTREVTVLPGLVKETDEKGIWLKDAQVLVEPKIEKPM